MEGRRRERVALIVFLVLMVAGGIALVSYFYTGRSWSMAATIVDDQVGSMNDYSVVVFNGSAPPVSQYETKEEAVDVERTMRDAYSTSSEPSGDDVIERIMSTYQRVDKRQSTDLDRVYVSDVRDLYELKGASVVTINASDPEYYAEPVVLHTPGRSFGVFSLSAYTSRARISDTVKGLEEDGAQSIICVAPRSALLSTFDGIDVVVLINELEDGLSERDAGETLVVNSPEKGSVGVVLFSSNNVPSFKTIEEL